MNDSIRHRGPDDEGYVCMNDDGIKTYSGNDTVYELKQSLSHIQTAKSCKLGLGFRRLSILDLSHHGHQPMVSHASGVVLTFNGEIYNYKELRNTLQQLGVTFSSSTDTEVVLRGYEQWGMEVVQRLNGMFAFALLDSKQNKLFLVRDRLGIKPLFYHHNEQGITWASEMKALFNTGWVKAEVNWEGILANYQLQTTPYPHTCFQNINSVSPSTYLDIDITKGVTKEIRYWEIPILKDKTTASQEQIVEELDHRLQEIVSKQLRSDVPVTSLMSGGIDSTTLTAICTEQRYDFHAYTLGFDGSGEGTDELPQAKAMAKKLGVKHHVHIIKPEDILDNLEDALRHFEEPYTNLEPGFAASSYLHEQGYKVVMNGLGADEVFGGYAYYQNYMKWQLRLRYAKYNKLIPAIGGKLQKAKSFLELDTVLKYHSHFREGIKAGELQTLYGKGDTLLSELLIDDKGVLLEDIPEALYYYDVRNYVSSHHVFRDDLSAMGHSVEMRYPFLDHELIEWVATIPLNIRYTTHTNKPLLRKVAEKYIAVDNLNMPKKGFSLPLNKWLKESNAIQDYAAQKLKSLKGRGVFNNDVINKWWSKQDEGMNFSKIWQLVTTEVWLQEYIDEK